MSIRLLAGLGVEGDAYGISPAWRVTRPAQPEAVRLMPIEALDELRLKGYDLSPGELGGNIARGMHPMELAEGVLLHIGVGAVVELTGFRNPCMQLAEQGCAGARGDGNLRRKAGVMAVVRVTGEISAGDMVRVEMPSLA